MITRSRWIVLPVGLAIVFSMTLTNYVSTAVASGSKAHAKAAKCAKRNKSSGTIRYSDWQFPDLLNPYQTSLAVSAETQQGMFENLVKYNSQAKLMPIMAATIPSIKNGGIKNGGKQYIFHLKKGLRWSNGKEITSADVRFGWRVDMDKLTGPLCSGSCDVISRIDTPDKYTAVFNLKKVYAPFIPNGLPDIWPSKWSAGGKSYSNPHDAANLFAQDTGWTWDDASYPTSGAYQVGEYVKDDRIVLHPMKYYANMVCGGYVKNVIFAFYSSKPALIAAAASKQTDVTQDYTVADVPELKKHTSAYHLHVDPGFIIEHMELNVDPTRNGKPNPLHNANVRLALALALDKYGLVQSALGVNRATAKSVIAWTWLVNTPNLVQPFADKAITGQWDPVTKKYTSTPGVGKALADAKKLLNATQFKGGFPLDFYTTSGNPVRQAQEAVIAASWARLNVKVSPNYLPASKLFADWDHGGPVDHGDFDIAMFAYLGSPDPDGFKTNMESKYIDREAAVKASINSNNSGIHDKVFDKQYEVGAHSLTNKGRAAAYNAIQVEMSKMAYWIPLYFRPTIVTDDGRVLNFSNNPTASGPEWNMFFWRPKAG